jgi:hypothetical protein
VILIPRALSLADESRDIKIFRSFKQLIGSLEEFKHQDEKYKQSEKKVADNLRESISR